MANPLLFKSSIILGFFNVLFVEIWKVPLAYRTYMWMGVFTSIWNHGTTSNLAKYSDRAVMFINAIPDIIYILNIDNQFFILKFLCFIFFFSAVGLFFVAKKLIHSKNNVNAFGNKQHLTCHFLITIEHFLMSYYFQWIQK